MTYFSKVILDTQKIPKWSLKSLVTYSLVLFDPLTFQKASIL